MTDLHLRPAVRGLLIDPADRILLVKIGFPDWQGWLLPGGGKDPGEDDAAALRRELLEETGLATVHMGPPLWTRRVISRRLNSKYDGQEETVYLVPCRDFAIEPAMTEEELRAEGVVGHRWWSVDELAATDDSVRPADLADRVAQILEFGAPAEPAFIEERID